MAGAGSAQQSGHRQLSLTIFCKTRRRAFSFSGRPIFGGWLAVLNSRFEHFETLFYKSVKPVAALFVFLPVLRFMWQKMKGFPPAILLL
ncbi:hypothetical protein ACKJUJ_000301 [Cronobacter sakazakii]